MFLSSPTKGENITQGRSWGASITAMYFIDEMYLEKVVPDHYEGWEVAPGQIAHNHLGYATGFPKIALASDLTEGNFSLVDVVSGNVVMQQAIEKKKTSLGKFQVLDFNSF